MSGTLDVTAIDSRRLEALIQGRRAWSERDASSLERLEQHLEDARIVPAQRIGPNVVTMNSEVRIQDLDTRQTQVFRVVFPTAADPAAGRISVLAPLGMAVLGRRVGETVTWETPGGVRRLQVRGLLYQPEREGRDVA